MNEVEALRNRVRRLRLFARWLPVALPVPLVYWAWIGITDESLWFRIPAAVALFMLGYATRLICDLRQVVAKLESELEIPPDKPLAKLNRFGTENAPALNVISVSLAVTVAVVTIIVPAIAAVTLLLLKWLLP